MRTNLVALDLIPSVIKKIDASSNAAAVASKTAAADQFFCIDWITWSYDDDPTGGKLTVVIGSTTLLEVDVTSGGPGQLIFERPLFNPLMTLNEAVTITLAAGGSGVTGKVSAQVR